MTKTSILLCVFIGVCYLPMALSEQIKFERSKRAEHYHYSYVWLDTNKTKQEFSFALTTKNVNNDFRHFKALRPSLLKMYSTRQLKKAINQINPREGKVKLKSHPERVEFEITGQDQEWVEQQSKRLKAIYQNSLEAYLQKEYYTRFDGFNPIQSSNHILYKPDHQRFIKESVGSLAPLVEALQQHPNYGSPRKITEFLLSWIQTIPYNEMTSRTDSNGAGYLPPIRVIDQNQGDCDSKVSLMASILKALFPNLRIAIVYLPKHALIGVNLSHLQEDYIIHVDGIAYTLAEPVGPAQIEFAEIAEESKRYIESGNYKVELLL